MLEITSKKYYRKNLVTYNIVQEPPLKSHGFEKVNIII